MKGTPKKNSAVKSRVNNIKNGFEQVTIRWRSSHQLLDSILQSAQVVKAKKENPTDLPTETPAMRRRHQVDCLEGFNATKLAAVQSGCVNQILSIEPLEETQFAVTKPLRGG